MSAKFELIIFGGTGDLAQRKLLPALYYLQLDGHLRDALNHIYATGRQELSTEQFLAVVEKNLKQHVGPQFWRDDQWRSLAARLHYVRMQANEPDDYNNLRQTIHDRSDNACAFYLATLPSLYGVICHNLKAAGLTSDTARVVLEKPIGHNLATCKKLNSEVGKVFSEAATFRIDHYLGKDTVQNLIALRFGNALFSSVWNSQHIESVQITVAEDIGVEGRSSYYGEVGALRDMVQNHLLQLLCLVAMEPPNSLDPDAIRDEKVKILRSLSPINRQNVNSRTVRGQYTAGTVNNEAVPGFLDQEEYKAYPNTETFVAVKTLINTWRWAKVPFFLRTGKCMARRYSEIVIEFRPQPLSIFPQQRADQLRNRLVIRLQPEENITLFAHNKKPGLTRGMALKSLPLQLTLEDNEESPRAYLAYERLLLDVLHGDQTLFMRRDEVEAAWQWTDGILASWQALTLEPEPEPYAAGTMGPASADALTESEGVVWYE